MTPATKKKPEQPDLENKKARVLGTSEVKTGKRTGLLVVGTCVLALLATVMYFSFHPEQNKAITTATTITPVNGELIHAAAPLTDGLARHYVVHTEDGVGIRYFVLQTPDGRVRTAFDACDVCWRADMGYAQNGEVMICRNCGMRFSANIIGEVRGGCNPTPLQNVLRQGQVVIQLDHILEGRRYFAIAPGSARG
jgi:uncharacterized membrane protein